LLTWLGVLLSGILGTSTAPASFAELDRADTPAGYLARVLINKSPFPGERGYLSEADTQGTMFAILWVLHSRVHLIPHGYTQQQVAGVRSTNPHWQCRHCAAGSAGAGVIVQNRPLPSPLTSG